jgi:hypothetical protein
LPRTRNSEPGCTAPPPGQAAAQRRVATVAGEEDTIAGAVVLTRAPAVPASNAHSATTYAVVRKLRPTTSPRTLTKRDTTRRRTINAAPVGVCGRR